jgi:PAS domain-containing protein
MEAVRTQESHYARSLIEASLDPLITININGKITDMNAALSNITGMTRRFRQVGERYAVIQVERESTLVNRGSKQIDANNIKTFSRKAAPVAA